LKNWDDAKAQAKLKMIVNIPARELVAKMLQREQKDRPSVTMLLKEPFFQPANHDNTFLNRGHIDCKLSKVEGKLDEVLKVTTKAALNSDHLLELAIKSAKDAPNLMLIIPSNRKFKDWESISTLLSNKVKVLFVCPVTYSVPRNDNGDIKGYELTVTMDWYRKYGPIIRITYNLLKAAAIIGSSGVLCAIDAALKPLEDSLATMNKASKSAPSLPTDGNSHTVDPDNKELEASYQIVKGIASSEGDKEFFKTGLTQAYCRFDHSIAYVLDDPSTIQLYKEKGKACLLSTVKTRAELNADEKSGQGADKGVVLRKGNLVKGNKTRFYVLRKNGFISYYKDKEEQENDDFLGLRGTTKPKVCNAKCAMGYGHFEIHYTDGKKQTFEANPKCEASDWITVLNKYKV